MSLSLIEANLVCVGLVVADLLARMWRVQWILRGLGCRITAREAFTLNVIGDAACALTPLRIGGEPARLAVMLRSRVPATAAFVTIGVEVLAAWPVIIVAAGTLAWWYAPEWWAAAAPALAASARGAWPWLLLVVLLSLLAWLAARRLASPAARQIQRPLKRARVYWHRMPLWPLLASAPLTLVNLVSRVAILPVLALALPHPPPLGPAAVGSFALLYSQLLLPTPSGAGAIELGFLSGVAGELGPQAAWLLLGWRIYSNGVSIVLGTWLAGQEFGWPILMRAVRRFGGAHREAPPST